MDLALNNLQRLICPKNPTNQPTNQQTKQEETQGQFISEVYQVWIQGFLSPRPFA